MGTSKKEATIATEENQYLEVIYRPSNDGIPGEQKIMRFFLIMSFHQSFITRDLPMVAVGDDPPHIY